MPSPKFSNPGAPGRQNHLQTTQFSTVIIRQKLRSQCCDENFNNIDLMMIQGHDFLPAVEILKNWLEQYQRDLGRSHSGAQSPAK